MTARYDAVTTNEVNFDGLVGPNHNYSGLAKGNLASLQNQQRMSSPRQAALQGLQKIRWMMQRGVRQGVLPPQVRPDFRLLYRLGYRGEPQHVLEQAFKQQPLLFSNACSASSMWVANAATVAPSCDTDDQKLNITPANLISHLHRSIEVGATEALLRYVFSDTRYFRVNPPLPPVLPLSDEGAANHMRIGGCGNAIHVLVYGYDHSVAAPANQRYAARQSLAASQAVARLNRIPASQVVLVQQTPHAIDSGVFHNDVIALSHDRLLVCHDQAFVNQRDFLQRLQILSGGQIQIINIEERQITLAQAVSAYLFNSQIVTRSDGALAMLLPTQCQRDSAVFDYVEKSLRAQAGLSEIEYLDLDQSMKNGGGPACLRLRINLAETEMKAMKGNLIVDLKTIAELETVVQRYYPEQLSIAMLSDWNVVRSMLSAIEKIYEILELPESLLQPFLP
ncbi:N-succinylarginine dihydrolase [Ketobacter sp. MCCC 1A13808]|nr:N-succinylarginine dihydrolase [Ketobacter sp. MCCC 1A13808]